MPQAKPLRKAATPQRSISQRAAPAEPADPTQNPFLDELLAVPVRTGRKPILVADEKTLRALGELARLFCTQEEIAGVLSVSLRTLQNFMNANPEAQEAWRNGLQFAKVSMRRKQFMLADKNAIMAIFLGKQYLGQKDIVESNITVNRPANKMSEDELEEIARRAMPETDDTADSKMH